MYAIRSYYEPEWSRDDSPITKQRRLGAIMAGSGRPEQRRREQWARLVKEHEASGQSQRAFCAERGIGQSTLRYWCRRLKEDARSGERGAGARLVPVRVREQAPVRNNFV